MSLPIIGPAACLRQGRLCAGYGTRRGEAIPGENDGKIIGRVKEKTRQIPKRTPHASLKADPKRCST